MAESRARPETYARTARAVAVANLSEVLTRAHYLLAAGDFEAAANAVRQLASSLPPPEVRR